MGTKGIRINTHGDGGRRKNESGGRECAREKEEEGRKGVHGMIAREIRPSIGGGGYQRNKGTAGGKVRAISGKKSLVKGVEEGRYQRLEKKRRGQEEAGRAEDRFCIIWKRGE